MSLKTLKQAEIMHDKVMWRSTYKGEANFQLHAILTKLRPLNFERRRHSMASVRADQATMELQEVTKLLQLIFHRNKNQHHSTKWWKWLSMLKSCLLKLPHENADTAKARRSYMSDFLIPRCHR